MWLIDTGCGHDLVTKANAQILKRWIRKAEKPIEFATANGNAEADEILEVFIEEFGQTIKPYILESTPDVISVGVRCMKHGFSFVWPCGKTPYFILPNGQIAGLGVAGGIPYLRP
eukprot:609935-Alexandrium_andersonii.AAC.1